jgi:hypothetical protein
MPFENAYGNGGMLTTAEDLTAWNNFYWGGKLGIPSLLSRQLEPGRLNDGDTSTYAAGFDHVIDRGWERVGMGGNTAGYACGLIYYPQLRLSFAFITNTSHQTSNVVDEVLNLFIKDRSVTTKSAKVNNTPVELSLPAGVLKGYTGWYKNSRTGDALQLYLKDGKLIGSNAGFRAAPEGPLVPIDAHTFIMQRWGKIIVQPVKALLFIHPERDTVPYTFVDSASLTRETMEEYAGDYYSNEIEAKYSIAMKGKALMLMQSPHDADTLVATYKDGFYCWFGTVYFERDKEKKITGLKISTPRARNVAFRRL